MDQAILYEKIDTFSELSEPECVLILQNYLTEALKDEDSYFEWELISKIMGISYELRTGLVNHLRRAVEQNIGRINNVPIGDWIRKYNAAYPLAARNLNSFFEFSLDSGKIGSLNKQDAILLMRILRIYDYLLIVPPFDLEDRAVARYH